MQGYGREILEFVYQDNFMQSYARLVAIGL